MARCDQTLAMTRVAPDLWWRATREICPDPEPLEMALNPALAGSKNSIWLIARRRGQLVGSCTGEPAGGGTAAVFRPNLAQGEPFTTGRALLETVIDHFQNLGASLVYALLRPEDSEQEDIFVRAGFQRLGTVLHMAGTPRKKRSPGKSQLEFEPFHESTVGYHRLARTFERTCQATLDFPELHRWLKPEQSLDGYRQAGHFRPELWHYIKRGGMDIGCLLLNQLDDPSLVQLSYLGLIPSVRRGGLGGQTVQFARRLAARCGASQITLSVDQRNSPAVRCYQSAGFVLAGRHWLLASRMADTPMD